MGDVEYIGSGGRLNLHRLANSGGAGDAHCELCRAGYPTLYPRSRCRIRYDVTVEGPMGDQKVISVRASDLHDAVNIAVDQAIRRGDIVLLCDDDAEFVDVPRVAAYDARI